MSKELKNWFLLLLLACIWGSSFILMKKGMQTSDGSPVFSDTQVGALRMALASLVLLPLGLRFLGKIRNYKQFFSLTIVGLSGNFFPAFLFTYAESGISSGLAGMLNSFTPIFTIIIGMSFFKVKLSLIQLFGVLIGTASVSTPLNTPCRILNPLRSPHWPLQSFSSRPQWPFGILIRLSH